jgi:hypothetical protein
MKEYNLRAYRPGNTTSYIGRQQGEDVRRQLSLEKLDDENEQVSLMLPADTTSFNPSFFLGLLYKSIKKLGMEGFQDKYRIIFETNDEAVKAVLQKNIDDGYRNAINSLDNRNGISVFG